MIFEAGKQYKSKSDENGFAVIVGVEKNYDMVTFEYQTETGRGYEVPARDFWAAYYKDDAEKTGYPEGTKLTPNGLFTIEEPTKPAHYDTAIDTIAFAKANFTPQQVEGFMRINAIKYLQRVKKGQVLEDLKKSRSYIDMLIEMEEGK